MPDAVKGHVGEWAELCCTLVVLTKLSSRVEQAERFHGACMLQTQCFLEIQLLPNIQNRLQSLRTLQALREAGRHPQSSPAHVWEGDCLGQLWGTLNPALGGLKEEEEWNCPIVASTSRQQQRLKERFSSCLRSGSPPPLGPGIRSFQTVGMWCWLVPGCETAAETAERRGRKSLAEGGDSGPAE